VEDRVASQGGPARSSVQMGWQSWRPLSNIFAIHLYRAVAEGYASNYPRQCRPMFGTVGPLADNSGPVALGPASGPRHCYAERSRGCAASALRRRPKLDGASRPPRRAGSWQPSFFCGRASWSLCRCDDRNQGAWAHRGTYGVGRNLQTTNLGVRSSNLFGCATAQTIPRLARCSPRLKFPFILGFSLGKFSAATRESSPVAAAAESLLAGSEFALSRGLHTLALRHARHRPASGSPDRALPV
jgi:hypothetical protein